MGKKCIPGVICIENMTLFFLFVVLVLLVYFYYVHFVKNKNYDRNNNIVMVRDQRPSPALGYMGSLAPISSSLDYPLRGLSRDYLGFASPSGFANPSARRDPFNDPYAPPLQDADGIIYPRDFRDMRGLPINMETQGLATQYQQIGILENGGSLILPLMGRRSMVGRDKWQYYSISNTGTLNTKLPVTFQGRSCTSENGCDNISNGDNVYVKGYNDTFRATIYENNLMQYIPYYNFSNL